MFVNIGNCFLKVVDDGNFCFILEIYVFYLHAKLVANFSFSSNFKIRWIGL